MSYLEKTYKRSIQVFFPLKTCVCRGLQCTPGPSQVCQAVSPLGTTGLSEPSLAWSPSGGNSVTCILSGIKQGRRFLPVAQAPKCPQPGSAVREGLGVGGIRGSSPSASPGTGHWGGGHLAPTWAPPPSSYSGSQVNRQGFPRSQQVAAAASAHFVGSQLLIGICEWNRGAVTTGKGIS